MSFRYAAGINKPGFNPLAAQPTLYTYYLNSWGWNQFGVLGLGNEDPYSSPQQVGALTDWLRVVNRYTAYATKTNGTLWSWGRNNVGQAGLGNTTYYSSPKQIGALTNWYTVSTSNAGGIALKTDGTLWTWGSNSFGQLGLGNTTTYSSPKQVGALNTWSKISTGAALVNFAIKTDGTLWAWGYGAFGTLGLGNTTSYSSPKQVGSLTNWSSITTGVYQTYATKTDGTLWSWGANAYGQLGIGNTTTYSSPKQVGALTNWLQVTASEYFTLAVKTNGTLWSWGGGSFYGVLGLGNTTNYSSPKQVGALTSWLTVACGKYHVAAIKTDNTLWTWGRNQRGQLGDTTTVDKSSPVQIGSANWGYANAGADSTFALPF